MARWYREYGPALVAYASAIIGDRSSAEDALQQVFLELLKGKFDVPVNPKGYLFRAVRNTVLNLDSHNRRNVAFEVEQRCESWFEAPAELDYWSAKLESAIRTLPRSRPRLS